MKEKTKAFMEVLLAIKMQEHNIIGITQMLWEDNQSMDKVVDYIEQNPNATETQVMRKVLEIKGHLKEKQ